MATDGTNRGFLRKAGYEVLFRRGEWIECLVSREAERWHGLGTTEEEAIAHALRQMLPSSVAWQLFEGMRSDSTEAATKATGEEPPRPPATEPTRSAAEHTDGGEVSAPAAIPAPARPSSSSDRTVERIVEAQALEHLDGLLRDIDEQEPLMARLSPERQRLWLLIWICWARAQQEALPGSFDVERAVHRVARKLGDLAKVYWPGSVRALQVSATPADIVASRRGDIPPQSWCDAGDVAQRALQVLVAAAAQSGLDEHGWADAELTAPAPSQPDESLGDIDVELSEILRRPADELEELEVRRVSELASKLRWLRPWVSDSRRWGRAIGSLRAVSSALGPRCESLRELTDARYRPRRPWAQLNLGPAPEGPPPSAPVVKELRPALAEAPPPDAASAALAAWLVKAFDTAGTPELVLLLRPRAGDITALDEEALPKDRRVRRRLRELVSALSTSKENEADESLRDDDAPRGETEDDEVALPASSIDVLGAMVRPHTSGKSALFVSNREDRALHDKLTAVLGVTLEWCDGSTRRVQARCSRVAKGGYDLVLCATGFQDHAVDAMLVKAAQSGGVPMVRVNKGRPLACVRAIAREFGLDSPSSAGTQPDLALP